MPCVQSQGNAETLRLGPSRTERTVALSTTEVEHLALINGVKEAMLTENIVAFVVPEVQGNIRVLEDSQGGIALVENPLSCARSKHLDVRHHFVRGLLKAEKIQLVYVSTKEKHADMLTKTLGKVRFEAHRKVLMNLPFVG